MSLIGEFDSAPWLAAASAADTDGILDVADQLMVVQDRDPARAGALAIELTEVVTSRLQDGTLLPEVVARYHQTVTGYEAG